MHTCRAKKISEIDQGKEKDTSYPLICSPLTSTKFTYIVNSVVFPFLPILCSPSPSTLNNDQIRLLYERLLLPIYMSKVEEKTNVVTVELLEDDDEFEEFEVESKCRHVFASSMHTT